MKAEVYKTDGSVSGEVELPKIFNEVYREDLVRRAILAEQSRRFQPQGHFLMAGLNTTAVYVGAYGVYRTGRHMGIAIRPRQKLAGGAMGDVRRIPSSTKGRRAHPHKIEKILVENINAREYRKAIASAISGSANVKLVSSKHIIKRESLPIVVDDSLEKVAKTKELIAVLKKLGVWEDLEKSKDSKKIGGKRYAQRRRYRKGALIVANDASKISLAGRNIAGLDVCGVKELSAEALAPGAIPRLSIWTASALKEAENAVESMRLR